MKTLHFHFDPISPYAALAFARLPEALAGCSYEVRYVPVFFAGLLKAWSHKGPAEIPPKRDWTYRQVAWLAHRQQEPLQLPASHPFNPLPLLRLAWACAPEGQTPGRHVVEQIFHHVWRGGAEAADPARLQALAEQLQPRRDPDCDAVKQQLRQATEQAQAQGVFGVPTVVVDDIPFWGLDALEMVAAYLRDDAFFHGEAWAEATRPRAGLFRAG